MGRLFGTDGVRGVANVDLTAELAVDLAVASAHVLCDLNASRRPFAIVGRDTRASGEFLEAAVVAGLASAGVDVYRAGVLPTPAVAYLTQAQGADIGVVLSASHNPMPDNGIKLFARGGHKLEDAVEDTIERQLGQPAKRPTGVDVGRVFDAAHARQEYIDFVLSTVPHADFSSLKIVVDCAHGAASSITPAAFRALGANVIEIGCAPDGLNINDGVGSTHIDVLQREVVQHGADLGIAHDGDADRCLAVDHTGAVVDGDAILAILALSLKSQNKLSHNTVVATVMSNLGFVRAMRDNDISVVLTNVGDRYVLESMRASHVSLGGEQSGHVILLDHAGTGDGLLTALHLVEAVVRSGKRLAELASVMVRYPQVLINVRNVDKSKVHTSPALDAAVRKIESELGEDGRVLLRPSGTEPVVRVMVEAPTVERAQTAADYLADVVGRELAQAI